MTTNWKLFGVVVVVFLICEYMYHRIFVGLLNLNS